MAQEQDTQHALLIPWGHFARDIGLLSGLEAIKLSQKVYEHTPQAKVIEFLVAILSGAKYLQDISLAGTLEPFRQAQCKHLSKQEWTWLKNKILNMRY